MHKITKIALTGIGGTSAMTASSYLMSIMTNENFREPEHLEALIVRLAPILSGKAKALAGWGAHFAMGFVFAAVYVDLWERRQIKHNFKNGLLLGLISGLLGIIIWKMTFKAHPFPPRMNFDHYYLQRMPAHIVFAIAATITYRLYQFHQFRKIHF